MTPAFDELYALAFALPSFPEIDAIFTIFGPMDKEYHFTKSGRIH